MKYSLSSPRILALVALVFALTPGSVMAGAITVDGINDSSTDEYTNSFIANWTNEHHKHASAFGSGTDETTVWWEDYDGYYYLFIEAPLEAKNMIWGEVVSATDLAFYDVHNTHLEVNKDGSPKLDKHGDQKRHHDPLSGIDFKKAVGSEKVKFEGITARLWDKPHKKPHKIHEDHPDTTHDKPHKPHKPHKPSVSGASGLTKSATSLDYLLNGTCDTSNCAATTTTMSFEFKFDLSWAAFEGPQGLLAGIASNGIEMHLSPEYGHTSVPEPNTLSLLGLGLVLLGLRSRRKRAA